MTNERTAEPRLAVGVGVASRCHWPAEGERRGPGRSGTAGGRRPKRSGGGGAERRESDDAARVTSCHAQSIGIAIGIPICSTTASRMPHASEHTASHETNGNASTASTNHLLERYGAVLSCRVSFGCSDGP